jgi:hypothetical protein
MSLTIEKLYIDELSDLGVTGYTQGSVLFIGSSSVAEDNSNLFWDDTNNRLGIGTNSPLATLDVRGSAVFNDDGGDNDFRIEGTTDSNLLFVDAFQNRVGFGSNNPLAKVYAFTDANELAFWTYSLKDAVNTDVVGARFQIQDNTTNGKRAATAGFFQLEHTGNVNNPTNNMKGGWYQILLSGDADSINANSFTALRVDFFYRSGFNYTFRSGQGLYGLAVGFTVGGPGTGTVTADELVLGLFNSATVVGLGNINVTDFVGFRIKDLAYDPENVAYLFGTRTNTYGLIIDKQTDTGATNRGAIWINGDGANGAQITFGAGQDVSIYYDGTDFVIDPDLVGTGVVNLNYAAIALGGGATATLGTIGGSGPATAAQNEWLKVKVNGNVRYIPLWA